jgi:hypothetical protein
MIMCPIAGYIRALRSLELDFVNIDLANDASVEAFVAAAPFLEAISLGEYITLKALRAIATQCGPHLRHFYMSHPAPPPMKA